jgi:putative membrane protein
MDSVGGRQMRPEAPRDLGLALIATGIGVLVISSWQYRQQLHYLWSEPFKAIAGVSERPHRTPVFVAAIVLIFIGLSAFVSVFFRFT